MARNADGNQGPGLVGRCGLFCGSCAIYADLDERYKGITSRNLTRRRELGDAAWLAEQRAERACSRCGRPLIYGDDECAYCGATRTA